jgi:beta-xylosidase
LLILLQQPNEFMIARMLKMKLMIALFWTAITPMYAQSVGARNPIVFADVPDIAIIRVKNSYYMSSTTMHMNPGVPIMKSEDLVNWRLINYAYDTLASTEELNLEHGKNTYGRGSWASSLRFHKGVFYVTTFAQTTGKTYIFSTRDIERGPWKKLSFSPAYHDHSLFFDDDGKVYMIYGGGTLKSIELKSDLSGVKPGTSEKIIIENASAPAGSNIGLQAEGSQLFKVKGKYYLFNITWPKGGMRTVVVHRADKIGGPYEGRLSLQDLGVAQGGLIDTPKGDWFAYLFRDYGAVGRIPYLVPVKWIDGWPVLGEQGKVPESLALPANRSLVPGVINSDEFEKAAPDSSLPLVWQWNHNPDHRLWSLSARKGFLRLTTGRIDSSFLQARNTITQRTVGPQCSGITRLDISGMKSGDFAGLALLQKRFGCVGVKIGARDKSIVMISAESDSVKELQRIPLDQNIVFLKIECDFKSMADNAYFYCSVDGVQWNPIGSKMKMTYTLPHFMGYRFGLFNYATQEIGGHADFDYFRIEEQMTSTKP